MILEEFPNVDPKIGTDISYGHPGARADNNCITMGLLGLDKTPAYGIGVCKEYILDCTLNSLRKGHSNGMYNAYRTVSLQEVQLIVCGLQNKLINSLNLLRSFEDILNMPPTVVNKAGEGLIFRGNKRWMIAPPMLSLYALLIRSARSCDVNKSMDENLNYLYSYVRSDPSSPNYYNDYSKYASLWTDSNSIIQARLGIECILTYGDIKVFGTNMEENWPAGTDIHNRGIIAFSQGHLYKNYKNWYQHMRGYK